jgi:hypothetical protein
MDNRREYYRHVLGAGRRLPAELNVAGTASRRGFIVDLAVGGLSMELPAMHAGEPMHGTCFISFTLSAVREPLVLPAELVHLRSTGTPVAGFRFLPFLDPKANAESQKRIWRYLLDEQRQQLNLRRTG